MAAAIRQILRMRLLCAAYSIRFKMNAGLLEQGAEPRVSGAADRQTLAVGEDGGAVFALVGLDAGQAIEIEHERAVNPHESRRIEDALEIAERLLLEVFLPLAAEADVVVLRL